MFPSSLPAPRTPDSREAPPLKWGIVGTGWIAERFVDALHKHSSQQVVAVGSRTRGSAAKFAENFGIERAHGSYDELVGDPNVDVVYVATPHNHHHACATLALTVGKHTLIEKPIALNARQARDIAELAGAQGVFCMEALWTFFLPKFDVIRQVLADGVLGEIRSVDIDYGEHFEPDHRIFRQDLAGGPLLDLGTYPVALTTSVLGAPLKVKASGTPAPTGVNGQIAAVFEGQNETLASLHTTLFAFTPSTAVITGTQGVLTIDGPFMLPGNFSLTAPDGRRLEYSEPAIGHEGLHFQASAVARGIAEGKTESDVRPLSDSITTMAALDAIRSELGIVFNEEVP
ncbi:Gfo/Idh/MocA family protein [Hoyosella altamirensis]|uniref:Putative dehydrogenase n=1 Tax=Hoyosella altamirensis TaxID=616997 RepID=A0A839RTD2_9ACTN|nr:Gfo/Idh/MocA family oxidoreductase [Hoyosella altamirensis]MBB3039466.1 putative dehydrogenase [Hoyosella altamirensis]